MVSEMNDGVRVVELGSAVCTLVYTPLYDSGIGPNEGKAKLLIAKHLSEIVQGNVHESVCR